MHVMLNYLCAVLASAKRSRFVISALHSLCVCIGKTSIFNKNESSRRKKNQPNEIKNPTNTKAEKSCQHQKQQQQQARGMRACVCVCVWVSSAIEIPLTQYIHSIIIFIFMFVISSRSRFFFLLDFQHLFCDF